MSRSFGIWPPPAPEKPMVFSDPSRFPPPFGTSGGAAAPSRMMIWKAKKAVDKRKEAAVAGGAHLVGNMAPLVGRDAFEKPENVRCRFYWPKRKFGRSRSAPFAPRNTTSFLIRAKKSGGIAPLVSPCSLSPLVLQTPEFSPSCEDLADMVKEKWGVDGYGSMKGLIRLRWLCGPASGGEEDDDNEKQEAAEESSKSDVEEHMGVERRLDHDVSRFEMVYPSEDPYHGLKSPSESEILDNRVNIQDAHIVHLEEENLTLKERFLFLERQVSELKRRVLLLESINGVYHGRRHQDQ
ncbi:uncharacterized protein LOC141822052 [Curcuma longa]|uniref:uncharacterized protein LOC141822052 n=1 Tax=Curcuma longa TaxID=136217 RepID=UPI003D9FA72A